MTDSHSGCPWRIVRCLAVLTFGFQAAVAAESAADCAAIESPEERLACFDAAYRRQADRPPATPETRAPAAEPVAAAKPPETSDADFGIEKSKAETEGASMVSGISAVGRDGYGKLMIQLENGQIWRQVESKRFPADVGDTVRIEHGSFGSYKMYIQGKKLWTRVRRQQ